MKRRDFLAAGISRERARSRNPRAASTGEQTMRGLVRRPRARALAGPGHEPTVADRWNRCDERQHYLGKLPFSSRRVLLDLGRRRHPQDVDTLRRAPARRCRIRPLCWTIAVAVGFTGSQRATVDAEGRDQGIECRVWPPYGRENVV